MKTSKSSIIIFQRRDHLAGAQRALVDLILNCREQFSFVVVSNFKPKSPLRILYEKAGATTVNLLWPSPRGIVGRMTNSFLSYLVWMKLRNLDTTLLIANDFSESRLAVAVANRSRLPVATILRSPTMTAQQFRKYRADEATALLYTNKFQLNHWVNLTTKEEALYLLEDGVNPSFPFLNGCQDRGKRERLKWLIVGDASSRKGWKNVIPALEALDKKLKRKVDLDITFGDEIPASANLAIPKLKNISVNFSKRQVEFIEFARQFNLVINPSHAETFGLACVEVVALGIPVISTRTGVAPQIIPEHLIYDPNDPDTLANLLMNALNDWQQFLYNADVKRSVDLVKQHFTLEKQSSQLAAVLRSIFPPLSIIIIAMNEEDIIGDCVRSWRNLGDVIVLDSGSDDATREIAKQAGARVYRTSWLGYSKQKNHAATLASTDWILSVDADEIATPTILKSISQAPRTNPKNIYLLKRINYFMGKRVRFSGWSGDFVGRLYNRNFSFFGERQVHEKLCYQGKSIKLRGAMHHYSYRAANAITTKIERYAHLAATEMCSSRRKRLYLHPKLRGYFAFINVYLFNLGLLDGIAGFQIARMSYKYTTLKYSLASKRTI